MITPLHCDLAYILTRYHFSDDLAKVLKALFNVDQASLKYLKFNLPKLKLENLKRALLILVRYQLVDYVKTISKTFNQQYEYSVVPHRVFCFFRIHKFIRKVESRQGNVAGWILKCLAGQGISYRHELVQEGCKQISGNQVKSIADEKKIHIEAQLDALMARRLVVQSNDNLCLNIEKLARDYRDQIVVETVSALYNKDLKIKALAEAILKISEDNTADDACITAPVTMIDLYAALIPDLFLTQAQLDQYIAKLTTDDGVRYFSTCGVHPHKGPMFAFNIGHVIDHLMKEHISAMITTRFGPKCCRIFKVLLKKGPLLLRQIEEIVMLPARDVREYTYMLIKEGLLRNRQVSKTPDHAPSKSVFIMSVEFDQVVHNIADLCCRSMSNLLRRYIHESKMDATLLEQASAVERLLDAENNKSGLSNEDRIEQWNQYFNSHELAQLKTTRMKLDKILLANSQVDDTLFLAHTWLCLRPKMDKDTD